MNWYESVWLTKIKNHEFDCSLTSVSHDITNSRFNNWWQRHFNKAITWLLEGILFTCGPRSNICAREERGNPADHWNANELQLWKELLIWLKMQFISISMISRAANVFAARLVRHRPAACELSRARFDIWPCIGDKKDYEKKKIYIFGT